MLPLPLAIAREVADSMQLADGSDDGVRLARPSTHLERLKQGLLLYVQAKYVTRVPFTSLEPRLIQLGIGARSVNGAWGVVRDSLRELPALKDHESAAVATALIQQLTYVPRAHDLQGVKALAEAVRMSLFSTTAAEQPLQNPPRLLLQPPRPPPQLPQPLQNPPRLLLQPPRPPPQLPPQPPQMVAEKAAEAAAGWATPEGGPPA